MDFPEPSLISYTVYSKSECLNCTRVKVLIEGDDEDVWTDNNTYLTIHECDEYIKNSREEFLAFMKKKTNVEIKSFPIVFFNGEYIGGFVETKQFIEKRQAFASF
jgi:glutaredoxin